MSEGGDTPEKPDEGFVDLTALDFGPSWARGPAKGKSGEGKGDAPARESRESRESREHGGKGGKGERREKRGGGHDRRGGGRDDRRGGGQRGRHEGNRGGGRRYEKGGQRGGQGGNRRDRERGPRREEVPAPDGVTGTVMPVEEGLDRLSKEIMAGGRTYSVFDLAKLVLAARDRFNVNFKTNGGRKLILCRRDGSVWLDPSEAIRHLWRADWFGDCYEEVVKDVGPPKGNFQAVAKCGMSGELLGPPNYHGYQSAIAALHRERFGHMSLEQYKRRIDMDRSEEAVAAWLDRMSKRVQYRPRSGEPAPPAAAEKTAPEAPPAEEAGAAEDAGAAEETGAAEEAAQAGPDSAEEAGAEGAGETTPAGDGAEEEAEEEAAEEGSSPDEDSAPEGAGEEDAAPAEAAETAAAESPPDDGPLLADRKDVERHFKEHFFKMLYQETDHAWVSGDIPGNRLSPGLLTLLRTTVAEERRYPGRLTPILCRQMSGRHVAVFKWRKKLKAGPSRPHTIPSDISIADRPRKLLEWVQAKSGANLEALWKDLLPADADDKTKHEWYHDLHWLLNQGYVLLLGDSSLHIAKRGGPPARSKAAAGEAGGKAKEGGKRGKSPRKRRRRKRVKGRPGLYAWSSMTTAGEPKLQKALTASGLWPLDSRMNSVGEPDEAAEDDDGQALRRIGRDLI